MVLILRQKRASGLKWWEGVGEKCHLPLYFSQLFSQLSLRLTGLGKEQPMPGVVGRELSPLNIFRFPEQITSFLPRPVLCPRNFLAKY